ncbi:MAG: hypothetical protein ACE5EF_12350 [Dehalococcoidia bacterium]
MAVADVLSALGTLARVRQSQHAIPLGIGVGQGLGSIGQSIIDRKERERRAAQDAWLRNFREQQMEMQRDALHRERVKEGQANIRAAEGRRALAEAFPNVPAGLDPVTTRMLGLAQQKAAAEAADRQAVIDARRGALGGNVGPGVDLGDIATFNALLAQRKAEDEAKRGQAQSQALYQAARETGILPPRPALTSADNLQPPTFTPDPDQFGVQTVDDYIEQEAATRGVDPATLITDPETMMDFIRLAAKTVADVDTPQVNPAAEALASTLEITAKPGETAADVQRRWKAMNPDPTGNTSADKSRIERYWRGQVNLLEAELERLSRPWSNSWSVGKMPRDVKDRIKALESEIKMSREKWRKAAIGDEAPVKPPPAEVSPDTGSFPPAAEAGEGERRTYPDGTTWVKRNGRWVIVK